MKSWHSLIPEDLRRSFRESPYKLLILLILADLVFIVLDIISVNTELIDRRLFRLSSDGGHAEVYQYIKEFWIVLLLFYLLVKWPSYLIISWGLVFSYIFIDDAFRVHEQVGVFFRGYFGFTDYLGLPGYQFGEIGFALLVGAFILIVLGTSYILSDKKFRPFSNSLLFLLISFFFFSFFIDMIHELFRQTVFDELFTVIEDGGEMVVISVTTWYLFYVEP